VNGELFEKFNPRGEFTDLGLDIILIDLKCFLIQSFFVAFLKTCLDFLNSFFLLLGFFCSAENALHIFTEFVQPCILCTDSLNS